MPTRIRTVFAAQTFTQATVGTGIGGLGGWAAALVVVLLLGGVAWWAAHRRTR